MVTDFYLLVIVITKTKRQGSIFLSLSFIVLEFILLYSLTLKLPGGQERGGIAFIVTSIQDLPIFVHFVIILTMIAWTWCLYRKEKKYLAGTITRTSIKESLDNLPMGLCFYTGKGIVVLSNKTMNSLCHLLTGEELQDGQYFWEKILDVGRGEGNHVNLGGQTWSFSRSPVRIKGKDGMQLNAVNITELEGVRQQLELKSDDYRKMNIRLHEYSENLTYIKSLEERLEFKIKLHNQLGHILLATRKALVNENVDAESEAIFDLWKRNIEGLISGLETQEKKDFEQLRQAAADVGIKLWMTGNLPQRGRAYDIIIKATAEAINNAARHAEATKLQLNIRESDGNHIIELSNNGTLTDQEIVEGGGLSTLRTAVESYGGEMGIDMKGMFKLWITMPDTKGAINRLNNNQGQL